MSALPGNLADAVYGSPLATAATYLDCAGDSFTLRLVASSSAGLKLPAAELGVRGIDRRYRVRVSELAQPVVGDSVVIAGTAYRVDDFEALSDVEWLLYVIT